VRGWRSNNAILGNSNDSTNSNSNNIILILIMQPYIRRIGIASNSKKAYVG
jgi:hypothetical protein